MGYKLGDYLKDLNKEKRNLLREDPSSESDYSPYIINRILSNFLDTVLLVQEVNKFPNITKQQHYDYLIHAIRPKNRFAKTPKITKEDGFYAIKEWFGYNDERTFEAMQILDDDEIEDIKSKMFTGGRA